LVGLEGLESGLQDLAAAQREYVEARLAAGRPSASQLLPGHLAVLLATALPLLIGSSETTRSSGWRWFLVALASGGLLLSRSPIGIALAILAVAVVAAHGRSRRLILIAPVLLVLASAVVVATRPDVVRLDPLTLRVDNWRTAVAVWREAPVAGVGFGGFGQAAQTVDLELGNRPAHAHSVVGEGLAELGPLGASVSIFVLMVVARVAWRLRLEDPGLSASIMVVPMHNLFDFSWWVSGVALPWAVVFGWAVGRVGAVVPAVPSRRHDPARMMVTVTATILFALTVLHTTSRWTEWTTDASDPAPERLEAFERSWRLAPWRTEPALRAAVAAVEANDPAAIERVARGLDRVAVLRPFSADVATVRALVEQARGDDAAAAAAAWNADRRRGVTGRVSPTGVPDRGTGGPGAPVR